MSKKDSVSSRAPEDSADYSIDSKKQNITIQPSSSSSSEYLKTRSENPSLFGQAALNLETETVIEERIVLHRLPYMKMN
jgi:hypothetical protein